MLKLSPDGPPESAAPWEQQKDYSMWTAMTGLRATMEKHRKRQVIAAEKEAAKVKYQPVLHKTPRAPTRESTSRAVQQPETTFERQEAREASPSPLAESEPPEEPEEDQHRAAVQIQAVVRGMQQRRRRSDEETEVAQRVQEIIRRVTVHIKPVKHGAELPATDADGLWELIKGGHLGAIFAVDFLSIFADCKTSGLTMDLSNAVLANFSGVLSLKDPKEVYPRQVAALIAALNQNSKMELGKEQILEVLRGVPDPSGELIPGYKDLGVNHETRVCLRAFRKTLAAIALLMAIDECYVISHIVWHMTGDFEITREMGTSILRRNGVKPTCPARLAYPEFLHICENFKLLAGNGKTVFPDENESVSAIYQRALQHINHAFERRRARILHMKEAHAPHSDKERKRALAHGWTEVSIVLEELYAALPTGDIRVPNPLQMCFACAQFAVAMKLHTPAY